MLNSSSASSSGFLPCTSARARVFRFGEQVHQFHGAAGAGLERAAVRAVHGAKAHVCQLGVRCHETGQPRHLEHLLEMQGLALVNKIENAVGAELLRAVAQGGQVAGGVQIAAVGLLYDHGQRLAFLVLEFIQEYAAGALAFCQQAGLVELGNHIGQVRVVGAFAAHIVRAQAHAQAFVDVKNSAAATPG